MKKLFGLWLALGFIFLCQAQKETFSSPKERTIEVLSQLFNVSELTLWNYDDVEEYNYFPEGVKTVYCYSNQLMLNQFQSPYYVLMKIDFNENNQLASYSTRRYLDSAYIDLSEKQRMQYEHSEFTREQLQEFMQTFDDKYIYSYDKNNELLQMDHFSSDLDGVVASREYYKRNAQGKLLEHNYYKYNYSDEKLELRATEFYTYKNGSLFSVHDGDRRLIDSAYYENDLLVQHFYDRLLTQNEYQFDMYDRVVNHKTGFYNFSKDYSFPYNIDDIDKYAHKTIENKISYNEDNTIKSIVSLFAKPNDINNFYDLTDLSMTTDVDSTLFYYRNGELSYYKSYLNFDNGIFEYLREVELPFDIQSVINFYGRVDEVKVVEVNFDPENELEPNRDSWIFNLTKNDQGEVVKIESSLLDYYIFDYEKYFDKNSALIKVSLDVKSKIKSIGSSSFIDNLFDANKRITERKIYYPGDLGSQAVDYYFFEY